MREHVVEVPAAGGIPVGVGRGRGPGRPRRPQQVREPGPQGGLQERRGDVDVARAGEHGVRHVRAPQRADQPGVRERGPVAVLADEHDAEPGPAAGHQPDRGGVDVARGQLLHAEAAEQVVGRHAGVGDAEPEPRGAARGDGARGAEHEVGGADELLGLAEGGDDVAAADDEVGVELADDEEVEGRHAPASAASGRTAPGHALVVGGTGILAPAAAALAARGWTVSVLARGAAGDGAVAVDATDPAALAAALDAAIARRGPLGLALVYAPFAPADAQAAIAARVPGTLVHVLVSAWAAPGADRAARDRWAPDGAGATLRVTLGWTAGRWHTPAEVSRGVLRALDGDEAEAVVGRLRPWSGRPAH